MNFMVVKLISPYNGIIGRPGLKAIQAVPSTVHGMLKFPVEGRIATIRNTILIPAECASVTTSPVIPGEEKSRPANFTVALHPDFPDQEVVIGGSLSDKGRTALCSVLKKNLDIFAWQPSDMTGVPRSVAEHRLNIREGYSPVRQKKRGQAPEHAKAIQAEHDGSWRMCVDFTDLNKGCPQDCYPLPEIDWKVESLCGYPFKCFLDAYKSYHQIQLAEADEEKTAFHTGHGVYCYTKMPFGLKNAGATYQRLMDKAFKSQVERSIEVYVDDLVDKSHTEDEMVRDIKETFRTLRKVNMKLNPKKCSFGLAEGVFLGYVITPEGIKPCPDKTAAVRQLPSPQTVKEVQSLNGKLASLNRFLSKSAEKYLPLFQTLKKCIKKSDFRWTAEAEQAFKQLKQHLSELPLLVVPKPHEELIMYLSATYGAVSAVLMTERGTTQTPIYFISRALQGPELNYSPMEKLVLVEVLENKSIKEKEVVMVIEEDGPTWMTQLVEYLKEGVLSGDKKEARKLRLKARPLQEDYVMREIHEGSCSMHAGPRSVVAKAVRLGYYWPKMHKDARDMIRKCNDCQIHCPVTRHPQQSLTPITAQWPFYKWGIDIAGPFPEGPEKFKFLIVSMDYFTKWIEAKAVATITGGQVKKFIWDNIVCRFGIPGEIISDNGKQFADNSFKDCLREGIKARLGEGNKNWVEELSHVLWAHRTMIKSSYGDTPFSLTYETEAVIPVEIGMPTYRTAAERIVLKCAKINKTRTISTQDQKPQRKAGSGSKFSSNNLTLKPNLSKFQSLRTISGQRSNPNPSKVKDKRPGTNCVNFSKLQEGLKLPSCQSSRAKSKMMKYYNARVRGVAFKPGDFVYRSNDASHAIASGKLGPKWEGPYEVTEALGNGAYKLRSTDGTVLPRMWNVTNLK
nr:reverse transcriptase domain-containing protein [Tanacetum cinerariifolium]